GQCISHDKHGTPVIIEWQKTTLFSPEFATAMRQVWPLACQAYTSVEMQFLQTYPEVVGTENYFKPFEPLFKNGLDTVDWGKAEEVMRTVLKSHFIFDASTLSAEIVTQYAKDACYVVMLKDQQSNAVLGFITFIARANYAQGDIKVMSLAVDQIHQKRGLGKLLMSSILKISPGIKRIFLCTRVTNETANKAYQAWGFTKDENPIMDHAFNLDHWIFLEYKINRADLLQEIAKSLIAIR
ncbi:MAG: GNAT family N-acetyltransferase, partial [bacterium]